jgi:hypothetical protein
VRSSSTADPVDDLDRGRPFTVPQLSLFWRCSVPTARRRIHEAVRDGAAHKRGRLFWARATDLEAWALGRFTAAAAIDLTAGKP